MKHEGGAYITIFKACKPIALTRMPEDTDKVTQSDKTAILQVEYTVVYTVVYTDIPRHQLVQGDLI